MTKCVQAAKKRVVIGSLPQCPRGYRLNYREHVLGPVLKLADEDLLARIGLLTLGNVPGDGMAGEGSLASVPHQTGTDFERESLAILANQAHLIFRLIHAFDITLEH